MTLSKNDHNAARRGEPVRQRVLDGAERLLRRGKAEFSMRELASEAGVSFATPFNQFGSKTAIMHALSERRIDTMADRFRQARSSPDVVARVLIAVDTAVAVMLEEPDVNRAVMGWIGAAGGAPGCALARSTALWTTAVESRHGLTTPLDDEALRGLPEQLALGFRGALSFWTAGELSDDALRTTARAMAQTMLRGVMEQPSF